MFFRSLEMTLGEGDSGVSMGYPLYCHFERSEKSALHNRFADRFLASLGMTMEAVRRWISRFARNDDGGDSRMDFSLRSE